MHLYLQFGHGMMGHTEHLIRSWGGGSAVLSPRDLNEAQLIQLAKKVHKLAGHVWIDPQLYHPRADHHRLVEHDYWPTGQATSIISGGSETEQLISQLKELNYKAAADVFLIPGLYGEQIDNTWCDVHENLVAISGRMAEDYPRYATICISGSSLRIESEIEVLINNCETWDVDGFYIVPEHPGGNYLVEDPLWLSNLLILTSGLRLLNKDVVVGYSNHQMLCLAPTMADAICSGTWLNVRSFQTSKFYNPDSDSISRRSLWYYCPQSLTEYKIPFLDLAQVAGVLTDMQSPGELDGGYADLLFSGAQPTTVAYKEPDAFRHYLHTLRGQAVLSRKNTYKDSLDNQYRLLDSADVLLSKLKGEGVLGGPRDFSDIIAVNRAALTRLDSERGFVLARAWSQSKI